MTFHYSDPEDESFLPQWHTSGNCNIFIELTDPGTPIMSSWSEVRWLAGILRTRCESKKLWWGGLARPVWVTVGNRGVSVTMRRKLTWKSCWRVKLRERGVESVSAVIVFAIIEKQ